MGMYDDILGAGQSTGGAYDDILGDTKPKKQDNPLVRGLTQANSARKTFGALATGDYDAAAKLATERDAYQRANPGTPEGNQLMSAWEKGDGIIGGIKGVAGEFAKDWREAPSGISALQATGKNLSAMGGGIVEQIPNMVMPMAGMLAGGVAGSLAGPVGTVGGAFAGAATGNTAAESAEQVDRAIRGAGINPQDTGAVRSFLEQDAGGILGKSAIKGGIIGAVDTATMGIGGKMLRAPVKAATDRAIASLGINAADNAVVTAAREQIGKAVLADPIYQASQKGANALARNVGVAALEPVGEFTGEYLGQGAATGDWDTKGAMLEALSSLGQSGITYAGQKIYQAATSPLRGIKEDNQTAPQETPTVPPDVSLTADPVPVQQRIDAMLGLDTARMDEKGRALYQQDLAAAFNEPIGIRLDADQNEVPYTVGEYLDSQVKAADADRARERIPAQTANQQASSRLAQLADEEAQQHAAITQDLVRSAAQGGALSKAALTGIQTGATQMPVHPERAAIEQQMLADEAAQAELAPIERLMRTRSDEEVQRVADNPKSNPTWRNAAIADLQRRMATKAQPTTTSPLQQTATQFNLPENSRVAQPVQMAQAPKETNVPQDGIEQGAAPQRAEVKSDSSLNRDSSWVIRNKETGEVVMETFDRKKVDALNTSKYEAVPIQEYLGSLNVQSAPNAAPVTNADAGIGVGGISRKRSIENWTADELQARLNRADTGESPLTPESRQKIEAELAKRPARKAPVNHGLSVGKAPNSAAPVTVRNGIIFIGDEPAVNYDTEQDIKIASDATPRQIVDALKSGGAIATSQRFYGLPAEPKAEKQKPDRRQIDATKDTLFQAIAKLGGMDTQELTSNGFDQKDISVRHNGRVIQSGKNKGQLTKPSFKSLSLGFNMPLHKKGGMSFDGVLEELKQHGYFPEDATKNDAIEAFRRELGGDAVMTPDAAMQQAEMQAEQEENDAIGYDDLSDREKALVDFHAENIYDEDSPIEAFKRGMKRDGATEDEINEAIKQTFGTQETGNNDSGGTPQGTGETRDAQGAWNGSQDGEIQESAEPDWLTGQTNEQAAAELAKRKADIAEEKRQHEELIAKAKRESNAKEKARRAAQVLAEREAAKKAEVDKAAEDFALGQAAPAPVERKVTTEDARGQQDVFAQPVKATTEAKAVEPWQMTRLLFKEHRRVWDESNALLRETGKAEKPSPYKIGSSREAMERGRVAGVDYRLGDPTHANGGFEHHVLVAEAVKDGKPVPANVLADYPDLKPKAVEPAAQSAEQKIRAAFDALPSISLGVAYPITVEHNGVKREFMVRQDAIGRGKIPALHVIAIHQGRMIASDEKSWIAQSYKLNWKNELTEEGLPKKISDQEADEFKANFKEKPAAVDAKKEAETDDGTSKKLETTESIGMPISVSESAIDINLARNAFNGTSHSPEKRGDSVRSQYVSEINGVWDSLKSAYDKAPKDRQESFVEAFKEISGRYASMIRAYLSAHSRVMSSMIVGPARFPVERNRKRIDTADRRAQEANDYLRKSEKRLAKILRGALDRSIVAQINEAESKLAEREQLQELMRDANAALRKKDDEALRELGLSDTQIAELKKPDFAGRTGFADYKLKNNNAEIKRLRDRVEDLKRRADAADESPELNIAPGVRMVRDATANRLQLFFDGKPDEDVRQKLKAAGFRWAPSVSAWQRQLTDTAVYAAGRALGVDIAELKTKETDKGVALYSKSQDATQSAPITRTEAESRIKSILGDKLGKVLIDSGIVTLVDTEQGLRNLNGAKYMVAWHGSPHDHDKFDSSKIGTGEGAQAYGYGLYFAGSRDVAEYYKKTLSSDNGFTYSGMKGLTRTEVEEKVRKRFGSFYLDGVITPSGVASRVMDNIVAKNSDNPYEKGSERYDAYSDMYSRISHIQQGKLYQVELAPTADEYLDWDKPLSEQSDKVKAAIEKIKTDPEWQSLVDRQFGGDVMDQATGRDLYKHLANNAIAKAHIGKSGKYVSLPAGFNEEKAASEYLHSLGIRGIRYLDGSSRSAGEGNSNYVIFSDDDVSITAKYAKENGGILGATLPDGKIVLVLENLSANNFDGVFKHEGVHSVLRETLGEDTYKAVEQRFVTLMDMSIGKKERIRLTTGQGEQTKANGTSPGSVKEWFNKAIAAIPKDTKPADYVQEIMGYATEQYTNGAKQPNIITRWVESLLSALRTAIIRRLPFGKLKSWAVNNLQPQDLANLAIAGLKAKARGQLQAQGREAMAFSRNENGDNVLRMADKDTVAGTQAPTSAGDGSTGSASLLRDVLGMLSPRASIGGVGRKAGTYSTPEYYSIWSMAFDKKRFDTFADAVKWAEENGFSVKEYRDGFGNQAAEITHIETQSALVKQSNIFKEKWSKAKPVYLRYGKLPPGGKSRNYADNIMESGVSVFNGYILPNGEVRVEYGTNQQMGTGLAGGIQSRDVYVASGDEIGVGSDGEPVLANVKLETPKQAAKRLFKNEPSASAGSDVRFSKINQTDTPAFKKWFGKSAVVDADGKPLVVYHGTNADFSVFKTTRGGEFGPAIYLTDNPREAGEYGEAVKGISFAPPSANIMPVYARIENPYTKGVDAFWKEFGRSDSDAAGVERAKAAGYDGIIAKRADRYYDNVAHEFVDLGNTLTHYIAFSNTQVKSAIGNNGNFDGANPDIRYSRAQIIGDSGRPYDQTQRQFFKNVGRDIDKKNLIERTTEYLKNDFWKKMAVGIVDQFRGLRDLGDNGQAYMLARLSKGTAGALDALLHHGKLSIRDGVYDADTSGGFIERLGEPLHGELDDFLWYVAANRAEGLSKVDRENLFTPADIAAGKSLAKGQTNFDYTIQTGPQQGTTTRNRTLIYADANRVFNEFQKNALDMAEQSGLIDSASRKLWESEFYVPFYRVSEEDGEFIGAKMGNALVRQQAFKKLKGGTDKLNSDLLSNTLLNFSHLIEASAKNRAAKASLAAAEQIGVAERVAPDMASYTASNGSMLPPGTKGTVWFQENGKKVEYKVTDPFVMTAITSLEYAGMRNGVMDVMTKFKHWLTIGVTASPAFKVRNLIRDSIQSIGASDLSYNPIKNIAEGYKQTKRDSQEYVSALASGGLIRFGTMLEGSESSRVRQLVKSGVKDSTILNSENKWRAFYDQYLDPAVSAYNELGNRSEEINRAALYNQLIKQGKSHAEAALLARDLMDFSMQGSFNTIRFLTQVVPFMNARLQGMYKLGRAAKDNPRKLAVVTGAVALASIALMLAYGDDDDWKRREDWDRDGFWWFKMGGIEFRIPKPFEVGAIGSLAERSLELMIDDEMTGERFRRVVSSLVMNNLSMNPIPQAFKPILDLYANKDSFTGRPIESMNMERLDPTERFNSNTSMVARGLSNATMGALSPVQYDHLARAYFGWLGSFVIGGADMASRSLSNEPTKPALDYFKFATQGMAKEAGTGGSRYLTQLYDQAKELEQAYSTYRHLMKDGRIEEAKQYGEENKDKLMRYKQVEGVKRIESKFNEQIHRVERSDADAETKKASIERIQRQKEIIAQRIAPGYQ